MITKLHEVNLSVSSTYFSVGRTNLSVRGINWIVSIPNLTCTVINLIAAIFNRAVIVIKQILRRIYYGFNLVKQDVWDAKSNEGLRW